ncbi:hypothetical protein COU57_02390 [Candidatus Pacearchaeota archaeon CG10_big_fil_rev_8_21_14_0_10_32_14]|nr:MAG: hypothetical protein COU57_02390 [Candidatus Pacearchaeota archaeon CG10_big_fil_rev_8_21_14_0_10_32_14]
MILNDSPLSMAESMTHIKEKENETRNTELVGFIKKFTSLKPKDGKEMREKITALNIIKLKTDQISKIIDLLPDNKEDLNKIFTEINLDEDEANKILDIVKQYK